MGSLRHDLEILAANVALLATVTAVVLVVRTLVRTRCGRTAALRALREGNPRRYRAIVRLLRRLPAQSFRDRLALQDTFGLFWEGAFERALARIEPVVRHGEAGAWWPRAVTLKVECLIHTERYAEARSLLATRSRELWHVRSRACAGADEETLDAILLFHEGKIEASRAKVDEAMTREDARSPAARTLYFYSAAIAHTQGQLQRACSDLAAAVYWGGDLFVSKLAARAYAELFPGLPAIPLGQRQRDLPRSRGALRTLLANLSAGIRLLSLRRTALRRAPLAYDQTIWLAVANLLCLALLGGMGYSRGSTFLTFDAIGIAGPLLSLMLTVALATRGLAPRGVALSITGRFYSALPLLLVFHAMGEASRNGSLVLSLAYETLAGGWSLAVFVFLVRGLATNASAVRVLGAALLFAVTWLAPMRYVARYPVWSTPVADTWESETKGIAEAAFAQADLAYSAEAELVPERPGVVDLYFLGFAGWTQDVFLNEVTTARALFDERFDTRGRSILLLNNRSTRTTVPMATRRNLGHALKAIASRMNRDEDVLFLLMTSHGSDSGLSVSCPDLFLCDGDEVAPTALRKLLDDAAIKWRVLVISGCKSGVFVGPLKNDDTLVATASASDRLSYGCGKGNQLTEFGKAVFAEQLVREKSFPTALAKADEVIKKREARDRREASEPQLFVGAAIAEKLRSIEARVPDAIDDGIGLPFDFVDDSDGAVDGDIDGRSIEAQPDADGDR
jgi:hypothetical protein